MITDWNRRSQQWKIALIKSHQCLSIISFALFPVLALIQMQTKCGNFVSLYHQCVKTCYHI